MCQPEDKLPAAWDTQKCDRLWETLENNHKLENMTEENFPKLSEVIKLAAVVKYMNTNVIQTRKSSVLVKSTTTSSGAHSFGQLKPSALYHKPNL